MDRAGAARARRTVTRKTSAEGKPRKPGEYRKGDRVVVVVVVAPSAHEWRTRGVSSLWHTARRGAEVPSWRGPVTVGQTGRVVERPFRWWSPDGGSLDVVFDGELGAVTYDVDRAWLALSPKQPTRRKARP